MTIKTICPNCGKKYSLKDEHQGKKAKCHCGYFFTIVADANYIKDKPWAQPNDREKQQKDDRIESEKNQEVYSHIAGQASEGNSGRQDNLNSIEDGITHRTISNNDSNEEQTMLRRSLVCLGYGSPTLIILFIIFYLRIGIYFALVLTAVTLVIFVTMMYKIGSVMRDRAAKQGMTFSQYGKRWSKVERTPKYIFMEIISYGTFILVFINLLLPEEWGGNIFRKLSLGKYWKMALLLIGLNIPILLLISSWLVGSWKKYLLFTVRFLFWEWLPFRYFFKGYWRLTFKMSREELFGMAATDSLYFWLCFLEYLTIMALF